MKKIVSILLVVCLSLSLFAKNNYEDDLVDHLALATLMIYDGKFDKARGELGLVNTSSETFDGANYYTVKGVLDSKTQNYASAIVNFNKAIDATDIKIFEAPSTYKKEKYLFSIASDKKKKSDTPKFDANKVKQEKKEKLYIYLSQAYYKTEDYANTVKSLNLSGERGRDRAALFALRAECYWKTKEYSNAINALNEGSKLFIDDTTLLRQKFYYYASLELYQSAIKYAKIYMDKIDAKSSEYIALAQLLMEANQIDESIKILEKAKLKFSKDAKVGVLLGHAYLKKDMKFTTAHLLKVSSYYDKNYLKDAVEMHRRIKDYPHAIFLNSQVNDKNEKLKQKIAIYLDRGEFEKVIGLKDALNRYNLLENDNIRYALAYAYYMVKDYENAEWHLKKISDNELFTKATVIRKNIEKCRDNSMECI